MNHRDTETQRRKNYSVLSHLPDCHVGTLAGSFKVMSGMNPLEQRRKLNDLSGKVIGLCIEIHRALGPGLLESAYEECLAYELSKASLRFERQKSVPVQYKEVRLDCGYRVDFVLEELLIIELKAVAELHPIHEAQMLTYLKLNGNPLGLLINFNVPALKQGVKRVVCGELFLAPTD